MLASVSPGGNSNFGFDGPADGTGILAGLTWGEGVAGWGMSGNNVWLPVSSAGGSGVGSFEVRSTNPWSDGSSSSLSDFNLIIII